jgi:4-oxalocrotonate tautomerase
MPFVTIKMVEGHNQQRRDTIAQAVTNAIHEQTQIPKSAIWVVVEDVKPSDWYTEGMTVAEQRAKKR